MVWGDVLSFVDEDRRDSLMGLFFTSAKTARTNSGSEHATYESMHTEAIQQRLRTERGEELDEDLWNVRDTAREAVDDLVAHLGEPIRQTQAAEIYREIGRLSGPLWLSGESEGFPELAVSVKHYAGAVPVEEVREIFGVAVASRLTPLLWTSGTLTASASQFADIAPVAVVQYDVETATWEALNDAGVEFLNAW